MQQADMNKKKKSPLVFLSGTCLVTICVSSVGYSAYLIVSTTTREAGVSVIASEVIEESGITIRVTQNNSNVMFDSMYPDTSGRVTSDSKSQQTPTIEVIGYLEGYTNENFIGINPVLQVAEDDREAYDYLVDNNYIVEPSFSQLGKTDYYDNTLSTINSFYWTSASSDQRTFMLNYQYTYGSFFNYMNPSEFFDSTYTNSLGKKGTDYSTSEIREILSRFEDVNDAKYTLYLDVMTEGSLFDVTVDAGVGSFSSTDTTTKTYTISNLTYHSKVEPLTPYLDDNIFQYWKYDSSSTQYTGYFYINELATFSVGTSIEVTAQYKPASSSFSVMFDQPSSGASVTFNVQSEDGIKTYTWVYGDTQNISLRIGDVITVTNTTAVSSISASSSVGLTRLNSTTFRVTASTCSLYAITIPSYKISFQLSTSTNLTFINFMAGDTEVQWTSADGFPTVAVTDGEFLTLSNVRGVSSFSDGSSSGSTLTIKPTSDTTITITPATAIKLTVSFTKGDYDVSFNVKCRYTYNDSTRTVTFAEFSGLNTNNNSLGTYYYVSGETWIIDEQTNVDSVDKGTTSGTSTSATISSDTTVTVKAKSEACILPGTLINMADGSYKKIEDVNTGDEVLVFDHMTGKIRTSPVAIKVNEESKTDILVMSLAFSNGKKVNVVYEHGFFDVDLNKYIYVNKDTCLSYVGHRFYALEGNGSVKPVIVTLDSVETFFTTGRLYELVSKHTVNTFNEDILSIPGVAIGIFNYLDLDENMKVIPERMREDIEKYGLFTYEEWAPYITEEEFDALNVRYLKISIGKGNTTLETLIAQAAVYLGYGQKNKHS